jgi:hypothetical protein
MIAVNRDALLARDEAEAFAEFEQKLLQVIEERSFDVRFGELGNVAQLQELEHHRVFDEILRRILFAFVRPRSSICRFCLDKAVRSK